MAGASEPGILGEFFQSTGTSSGRGSTVEFLDGTSPVSHPKWRGASVLATHTVRWTTSNWTHTRSAWLNKRWDSHRVLFAALFRFFCRFAGPPLLPLPRPRLCLIKWHRERRAKASSAGTGLSAEKTLCCFEAGDISSRPATSRPVPFFIELLINQLIVLNMCQLRIGFVNFLLLEVKMSTWVVQSLFLREGTASQNFVWLNYEELIHFDIIVYSFWLSLGFVIYWL